MSSARRPPPRCASGRAPRPSSPRPICSPACQRSVAEDRRRRRWRTRIALISGGVLAVLAALVLLTTEHRNGEAHMDWWIFEVLVTVVLIAIAVILGPFIKRFGRSYAAEVFRSNPTTGKSFIVLTDVAYYLIFTRVHPLHRAVRSADATGATPSPRGRCSTAWRASEGSC